MRYALIKTIQHLFPALFDQLRQLEDGRQKADSTLAEILMAGIALCGFQQGSRNAFNNRRAEAKCRKPYGRLFKLRLPHLDTVPRGLCQRPEAGVEQLNHQRVQTLLEKQGRPKYRWFGGWFIGAIAGTGVMSCAERHGEPCRHPTSKSGQTT